VSGRDVTVSDEVFGRSLQPEPLWLRRIGAKPKMEARIAELLAALYAIHPVGGPLHVEVDDGNLDGVITPWYDGWPGGDLDELWFEGVPIAELSPMAPAVVEGLGMSTRQICDELAALLNAMTVEEREAVVARHHGDTEDGSKV
jgi:hypothetical protein